MEKVSINICLDSNNITDHILWKQPKDKKQFHSTSLGNIITVIHYRSVTISSSHDHYSEITEMERMYLIIHRVVFISCYQEHHSYHIAQVT